jgi:hypothetical protein
MLTKKGNSKLVLLNPREYVYSLKPVVGDELVDWYKQNRDAISDFLMKEKRGSKTIEAELTKIDIHWEHIAKALRSIRETYETATQPQTRTSAKEIARREMLTPMPDKMLKQYAETIGIDVSEIVLPDDRVKLIDMMVEYMREHE